MYLMNFASSEGIYEYLKNEFDVFMHMVHQILNILMTCCAAKGKISNRENANLLNIILSK